MATQEAKNTKILPWNKGRKLTKRHKSNISKAMKGRMPWNKGKKWPEEIKSRISKTRKGQKAWNRGIKRTTITKRKISLARKGKSAWNKGKKWPADIKKKISRSRKGQPAWNKGKKWSKRVKNKIQRTRLMPEMKFIELYNIFAEHIGNSFTVDQWLLQKDSNTPIVNCIECEKRKCKTLPTHVRHCIHHKEHGTYTKRQLIKSKSILSKLVKLITLN